MTEIAAHKHEVQQGDEAAVAMTTEDVARRLAEIHANRNDDEVAHGMADDLYHDALLAIAAGAPNAEILASAALRLETIDFARWCA